MVVVKEHPTEPPNESLTESSESSTKEEVFVEKREISKCSNEVVTDAELSLAKPKTSEVILVYPFIGGKVVEDAAKELFL